jgi:hypothetical protein
VVLKTAANQALPHPRPADGRGWGAALASRKKRAKGPLLHIAGIIAASEQENPEFGEGKKGGIIALVIRRLYVHKFRCLENFELAISDQSSVLLI